MTPHDKETLYHQVELETDLHVAEELFRGEGNRDGEKRLGISRGDVELQGTRLVRLIEQIHRPHQSALLRVVAVRPVRCRDLGNSRGAKGDSYAHVVELH